MKPLFCYPLKDNTYREIDGDTVEVLIDRGWWSRKTTSLRLFGLNAPESRTSDPVEKKAGLLVKQLVSEWLKDRAATRILYATSDSLPKYAKRTIGRLVASDGTGNPDFEDSLNQFLLGLGVVKVYTGGKREWSVEELVEIAAKAEAALEVL